MHVIDLTLKHTFRKFSRIRLFSTSVEKISTST